MSPLVLRRYRADRLLREEFQALRSRVLRAVSGRLRARGMELDSADLDACYATAWQGLHAAVLEGQEIESPLGWLVLVTYRRAVEECRARPARDLVAMQVVERGGQPEAFVSSRGDDLADELDDRMRLVQLFEGLHVRLSTRERQAATLCYLQGLSRAEAAVHMGVSKARMRKLMEGRGAGDPGVRGKLGALAATIESGEWCQSQGSLMRALAYGVLSPDGERHRLALMHRDHCPACRAYVLSLRGLAGLLPPVLLPWGPLAAAVGGARGVGRITLATRHGAQPVAATGNGLGGYASSAAGASGAASGGWLLGGGGLSAKLAVGCLIALGVGGGCVALEADTHAVRRVHRARHAPSARVAAAEAADSGTVPEHSAVQQPSVPDALPRPSSPAVRAAREFGPEQTSPGRVTAERPAASSSSRSGQGAATARVARRAAPARSAAPSEPQGDRQAAAREFSPG